LLDVLGLSPRSRSASRGSIVRSERSAHTMSRSRVAMQHGYFDQAHLANDVRALAGLTPRALARAVRSVGSSKTARRRSRSPCGRTLVAPIES
jgi:hypothetical protein